MKVVVRRRKKKLIVYWTTSVCASRILSGTSITIGNLYVYKY